MINSQVKVALLRLTGTGEDYAGIVRPRFLNEPIQTGKIIRLDVGSTNFFVSYVKRKVPDLIQHRKNTGFTRGKCKEWILAAR